MNIALYVMLGISVLVDLALGAWAGVAWGSFVGTWKLNFVDLQTEAFRDTQLLGLVLGFCLVCFAAVQALALYWIRSEKDEGYHLTILFGGYLVLSSLVTFLAFHRWEFLVLDGLRGGLLSLLAVVAMNSPATLRELRLPDPSLRPAHRGDERRRDDRRPARGASDRDRRDRHGSGRTSRSRPGQEDDRGRGRRRRGGREEGRPTSLRRERGPARDEEEPRERMELKDRLRPLISSAAPAPESPSSPTREAGGSGRRGRGPEDREFGRPRRADSRPRPVEEPTPWENEPARRTPPETAEEQPLTVVVRGEPDLRLRSRPLTPEAPPAEALSSADLGAAGEGPAASDRRRRRRRRPRGGRGSEERSPAATSSFAGDLPLEPEPEAEIAEERFLREPDLPPPSTPARPPAGDSSAYVEALDKLSLLEPHAEGAPSSPMEFGRTRKPAGRRRPSPSLGPLERGSEGAPGSSGPGPSGRAVSTTPSSDSVRTGPRPGAAEPEASPWPTDPVRRNDEEDAGDRGEES